MKDRATEYAWSVASGEIPAGKPHIQACERHLKDLKRQGTEEFPYIWRPEMSNRIIEYAEALTIAEGYEPKPLHLMEFQCFDLGVPFGWYNARGFRRFRRKYKSVARQNGKTFENGITGTYIAGFGGYQLGKLFTVATKKRQSRIAWEEMEKFINADKDLGELFRIQGYKSLITAVHTGCTIEALSREGGLDEGFRSIYASVDEIHQHRDNSIYKAIYNGTRSLNETLVSMITTRGSNLNSFCYEMDSYCLNILNGSAIAEDFFVDIYTLDKEDDYYNEQAWIKSNPLLARTKEGLETLRTDAETARRMGGSELRDFIIKGLNIWMQDPENQFVDVEKWKACGTEKTLESLRGRSCYVGLDLSSGGDLTTMALDFPLDNGKEYFYSHSYMPRGRLEEHIKTDLAPYDLWERDGLLTVTGGQEDFKTDYRRIIAELHEIQALYDLKFLGIGADPHNLDGILSDLEEFDAPVLLINQTPKTLSDATRDMQLKIKSKDIEYDRNNALMTWSFINAHIIQNNFNEIKVDKEPRAKYKRIDPVDACINAHVMYMKDRPEDDPNEVMQRYFSLMEAGE